MTLPLGGVRFRTTAAATAAVAIFLAIAAVVFVFVQRDQLQQSLTESAAEQAADTAGQIAVSGVPADLGSGGGDQSLVQVVATDGTVLAASPQIDGEPPVIDNRSAPGTNKVVRSEDLPIGEGQAFVVVAHGVAGPDGHVVVLVAQSLELVGQSTAVVVNLLAIGYPIVLVAVALSSFWLAGRALAPVEAIRSQVAEIQGNATLAPRVPVPDGGDEITRLAVTMNAMLGRLQDASDAQRRFVGDASHELRSPLASIRAAHEVAARHPQSTDWESTGHDVLADLDRIDRLVADLLLLARVDERGLPLNVVDVDLDDLVRTEANRLSRSIGVRFVVTTPPTRVQGDPHQLARAVRNLVENAVRHARSTVWIRLAPDPPGARLEIEDDGPGIPETDRERVFDRFVRLDESRSRADGGTGLGLPIAREIAVAHGGVLCVESSPAGALLVLVLPAGAGAVGR
ncbi:sensor histidine kinase [Promicromonospora panici]|uniref:sensor histidine kinase n=1 Tax=Promicromonospora panici TaxID=2219658 RepID=UPI00101B701B|nr:HAMP domain-containing sensor histidine kinase [Promicromonospora panici]